MDNQIQTEQSFNNGYIIGLQRALNIVISQIHCKDQSNQSNQSNQFQLIAVKELIEKEIEEMKNNEQL